MTALDDSTSAGAWDAQLDGAVAASRVLAESSPHERAGLLRRIAAELESNAASLIPVAVSDTGLGTDRIAGEITRTVNQFRLYAEVVEEGSWAAVSIDTAKPPFDDHRRMNVPLGPVLVFAASNFPFAFGIVGTDTASAIAAGCAVIAKPHPGHRALGVELARVIESAIASAGYPAEVFTTVIGSDAAVRVLRDDRIEAGSFTGSISGGTALLAIAQGRPRPIPFFAEMGSVNPVVVTAAAWRERRPEILSGFVASMTQSNGQLCTSPGVIFVPTDGAAELRLDEMIPPTSTDLMLTDAIASAFNSEMVQLSVTPGVQPLTPVKIFSDRHGHPAIWATATTTVLAHPAILEEHFGPSAVLVHYGSLAEVLHVIDKLDGQLTGSIFSLDGEDVSAITARLGSKVGRLLSNSWPTGVAVSWSMHHGGPWPSTSSSAYGSVGAEAIFRFLRPITYQNFPEGSLPSALRNANPWNLPRRIDGQLVGAS